MKSLHTLKIVDKTVKTAVKVGALESVSDQDPFQNRATYPIESREQHDENFQNGKCL